MPKLNIVPDATLEAVKDMANKAKIPQSPVESADRITAIIRFVHEHWGEEPFPIEGIGDRALELQEEPYKRNITIGKDWKELDLGGIDPTRVGLVVLENKEGKAPRVNPTPEQRAETLKKIVEVSYTGESSEADLLHPGMMIFRTPNDASKLVARCQYGTANCRIYVVSK